jgi:hypothetical protein
MRDKKTKQNKNVQVDIGLAVPPILIMEIRDFCFVHKFFHHHQAVGKINNARLTIPPVF